MAVLRSNLLALDMGKTRIGVAIASNGLSIARPLVTLSNDETFISQLKDLVKSNNIEVVVVGLPRGLDSQTTKQTEHIKQQADKIKQELGIGVSMQDEALTSVRAKESLDQTGKPYQKADIDAVAASLILSDYMSDKGLV